MYLPIMIDFEFIGDPFTTLAFGASLPYVVAERGVKLGQAVYTQAFLYLCT